MVLTVKFALILTAAILCLLGSLPLNSRVDLFKLGIGLFVLSFIV